MYGRERFSTNTYRKLVLFLQTSPKHIRKPPIINISWRITFHNMTIVQYSIVYQEYSVV